MVLTGLEPVTSPMWTARPNQLNYKTVCIICPMCLLRPMRPYCVILKSHFLLPPMRPFRAFLFGFLHFLVAKLSIESNISMAFFPDCNTFATPKDSSCTLGESFNEKNRTKLWPILLWSLSNVGSFSNFHCRHSSLFQILTLCSFDGIRIRGA